MYITAVSDLHNSLHEFTYFLTQPYKDGLSEAVLFDHLLTECRR